MGYVDLHCHLLWGLDDGCETPAETLSAARLLVALGFSDAAPSPHAIAGLTSGDAARSEARRAEAAELLAREGVPLALHPNAEKMSPILMESICRSLASSGAAIDRLPRSR
jgi:protein-tyrosine phosphatase